MPYLEDHLLLRFGGSAADNQETWSCGVRLQPSGAQQGATLLEIAETFLDSVTEQCEEYVGNAAANFNPLVQLEYVKLNPIGENGKYLFPDSPVETILDAPVAGAGFANGPLQVAYCVTLRGTYRRGPAAFGRYYVPCGQQAVTSTGVIPGGDCLTRGTVAGDFLEGIQALNVGGDPSWSLRLRLFGDGAGGPRKSVVRLVQVGNVLDTQRRRREQIEETYFNSPTWTEPVP